jgi:hypothetical protein
LLYDPRGVGLEEFLSIKHLVVFRYNEDGSILSEDGAEAFPGVTQQAPVAKYAAELLRP